MLDYANVAAQTLCAQVALHRRGVAQCQAIRDRGRAGQHGRTPCSVTRCPQPAPRECRASVRLGETVDGPRFIPNAQTGKCACRVQPDGYRLQLSPRDHLGRYSGVDFGYPAVIGQEIFHNIPKWPVEILAEPQVPPSWPTSEVQGEKTELLSNLVFWDRHAAARSGFDGLTPLMKSTPSMTSARWAKPRSLRQLVSAHCASLNIMCSIPGRVRQPLARLVR